MCRLGCGHIDLADPGQRRLLELISPIRRLCLFSKHEPHETRRPISVCFHLFDSPSWHLRVEHLDGLVSCNVNRSRRVP